MLLEVKNISCGYADRMVVKDISLSVASGHSLCLLGPNGVGKSTLFKTILGLLKPQSGQILLNGEDVSKWSRKRFAQKVGYVPQSHNPPFSYKVIDVVAMGRMAHLNMFASPNAKDIEIAEEALNTLSVSCLKDKAYTEISGGERQLVLIARALVQQPKFLIMDEPTSNLDFGNQIRVLNHIKKLVQESNLGVIMTTHDPNHALLFASRVAIMGPDHTFTLGSPDEVITEKSLHAVYGTAVQIIKVKEGRSAGSKVCFPILANCSK